jgi:hypothetical protein
MEVVESGKCWKLKESYARLGMLKHLSHVGGMDGPFTMTVTDFYISIISLLCNLNITT